MYTNQFREVGMEKLYLRRCFKLKMSGQRSWAMIVQARSSWVSVRSIMACESMYLKIIISWCSMPIGMLQALLQEEDFNHHQPLHMIDFHSTNKWIRAHCHPSQRGASGRVLHQVLGRVHHQALQVDEQVHLVARTLDKENSRTQVSKWWTIIHNRDMETLTKLMINLLSQSSQRNKSSLMMLP